MADTLEFHRTVKVGKVSYNVDSCWDADTYVGPYPARKNSQAARPLGMRSTVVNVVPWTVPMGSV